MEDSAQTEASRRVNLGLLIMGIFVAAAFILMQRERAGIRTNSDNEIGRILRIEFEYLRQRCCGPVGQRQPLKAAGKGLT